MILPYDQDGEGELVVLLHAGICDRRMWRGHLSTIAATGRRVVAPDFRGYGEAESATDQADAAWLDVLDTLDALGTEHAALVGNSFGGDVALRIAAVAPERVHALVLVSAFAPGAPPSAELIAAWEAEEAALASGDIETAVSGVLDTWLGPGAPAALRERVAAMQRHAFEVQAGAGEQPSAADPLESDPTLVGRIAVPTLVAVGELDKPDFIASAARLARELPQATRIVIPSAGHLAPLERPDAFLELLLGFLTELS